MDSDIEKTDNVVRLGGAAAPAGPDFNPAVVARLRRLEVAESELREKAAAARQMERMFQQAHARLEQRIADRTRELADTNAVLQQKAEDSARLEAAFGKLIADLEHRVQERALELLRSCYGVGTTVVDGPGRGQGIRLVIDSAGETR